MFILAKRKYYPREENSLSSRREFFMTGSTKKKDPVKYSRRHYTPTKHDNKKTATRQKCNCIGADRVVMVMTCSLYYSHIELHKVR